MSKLKIVGLDVESRRKGSDWSNSGSFSFRDLLCADLRFSDQKTHRFLPFDFTSAQLDQWANPLRQDGLLLVAHNGRYDLNGINATLIGYGLKPISPNVLCDTLKDGPKGDGWIRRDLGSMAVRYGITAKGSIDQATWDLAHNGDRAAQRLVKIYNMNDVDVCLDLQAEMARLGHLSRPQMWRPK